MKTKFITAIAAFSFLALTYSCSDDLGSNQKISDGELLFKLQFNSDGNQWKDGSTGTRAVAPLAVNSSEKLDEPLYLHIDMVPTTLPEPQADSTATRGQRYTGHVFENGITNFHIYGTIGSTVAFLPNTVVAIEDMEGEDANADWRVNEEQVIQTKWEKADEGNFYAIAPEPPASSGIGYDEANPTIMNFQMMPDEPNNYDVLTAKAEGVTWQMKENEGVELKFRHVMAALRFRVATDNPLTCTVNNTTYYIQVKKLKVTNIYDKGSYNLSTETWTRDTENTMSDCTVNITESHSDMVDGSGEHLINTDANCLMIMPQVTDENAQMRMLCELTTNQDGTGDKISDVVFDVPFGEKTLEQGVTYTFTLSKNSEDYEIYLSSTSNSVSEGPISIPVTGTAQSIRVASRMRKVSAGIESDWEPLNWHPEYSLDNGATWQTGLPEGYMLKNNRGMAVPDINNVLGNAEGEYTWQLEAKRPNFEFASTTALKNKQYTDHDLSLYDLNGTTPISRTTSNCYVVNGYGTFKFPVAYGNAIKNGATNTAAYTERDLIPLFFNYKEEHITSPYISTDTGSDAASALLLWQDEENMISPSSVGVTGSGENQYVVFTIKQDSVKAGNAVLAVKNSADDIMWSWHIWVTNLDVASDKTAVGATTFSNYILGWRDPQYISVSGDSFLFRVVQNSPLGEKKEHSVTKAGGDVAAGGTTLFYQYGRKDPFPGLRVSGTRDNTTQTRVYNELKNSGLYTYYPQYYVDNGEWMYNTTSHYETGSMPLAIKHPYHLFQPGASASDWMKPYDLAHGDAYYDYAFSGRWNPSKKTASDNPTGDVCKTVYDPCPYGYMVPSYKALNADLTSVTPGAREAGDPIPYRTVNGIKLYLTGYIDQNMGVQQGNAQLHLASSYTNAAPFIYYYRVQATGAASMQTGYAYRALSVLPMVDPHKTTLNPFTISGTYTCEVQLVPPTGNTGTVPVLGLKGFYKEIFDYYKTLGTTKLYVTNIRTVMKPSSSSTATSYTFRYRTNATQWNTKTYSYTRYQITNINQREENLAISPRLDVTNFLSVSDWEEGRAFTETTSVTNTASVKLFVTFQIE